MAEALKLLKNGGTSPSRHIPTFFLTVELNVPNQTKDGWEIAKRATARKQSPVSMVGPARLILAQC